MYIDFVTKIYFLAGAGIVFLFAVNYFNQPGYKFADEDLSFGIDQDDLMLEPALPKYLTDRFEYILYLGTYVLVSEFIYIMLVLFLPDLIRSEIKNSSIAFIPTRQNIVLSAFIITGIAPNLPYVRQLLERSKFYLHDKAQIPRKGRDVYRRIKSYQPCYTRAEINNILSDRRYVENTSEGEVRPDLNESDFKIGAWTLEGRWAKLSYLLSYINKWANNTPFRSYIGNRELQHSSILQAYDQLQKQMVLFRKNGLSEHDKTRLNALVDATLNRTYRLISCLLYLAGKTDSAVDQFLDQIGYAPSEREDFPIPWNNMVYVLAAIIGSIIVGGLLVFLVAESNIIPLHVDISTKNILYWCGYALPFLSIPVLWVLFLKQYLSTHSEAWPVITENNRYKKAADRPWHLYVIVAFAAYIIGGLVLLTSVCIVKAANGESIDNLGAMMRSISVWSTVVFVTSIFAAYRVDSAPNLKRPRPIRLIRRGSGALFQGITTMFVIFFAFLHTLRAGFNVLSLPEPTQSKLAIYCLIGFFLGASLYMASGFGRLRQRRRFWRRGVRRKIVIDTGMEQTNGNTVNISEEGALVQSDEYLPAKTNIQIAADKSGDSVSGSVVNVRGNYIHIRFPDINAWKLLQGSLEIPVSA